MGSWFIPVCSVLSVAVATTACSILIICRYRQIKKTDHPRIAHLQDGHESSQNGTAIDSSNARPQQATVIDHVGLNCELLEQVAQGADLSDIHEYPRLATRNLLNSHSVRGCQLMAEQFKGYSETVIPTTNKVYQNETVGSSIAE